MTNGPQRRDGRRTLSTCLREHPPPTKYSRNNRSVSLISTRGIIGGIRYSLWLRNKFVKLTWLPNTPMLHALLTWSGPNQTAARREGTDKTNTWLTATIEWPRNVTTKRSGDALNTLIHAPNAVPKAPTTVNVRRPCKQWNIYMGHESRRMKRVNFYNSEKSLMVWTAGVELALFRISDWSSRWEYTL